MSNYFRITAYHPEQDLSAIFDSNGYFEKLATDTATGGMADIVQMDYMYISTSAKNGSLADLSSYSSDGTLDTSTIDEALLGSGTIDGNLVGIPLASNLLAFI